MRAIMLYEYGGPEALKLEERPMPMPGHGEVLVQIAAAGVNFVDIYRRLGWYKQSLPCGIGVEGAGTATAVGPGISDIRVGDRVAWLDSAGSYATHAVVAASKLVPVPAALDLEQAAAAMVQGTTAHILATRTYPLKPGDRCLVHAAAGGAGRLLCQIAKMQGAFVIGTVSTGAKAEVARSAGADEVIIHTLEDFEAGVKRLTGGRGVNVVYDSVGKDTFDRSLACLAPFGYLVLFGQSSGFVPPFDIQRLAAGGSLFLTRPSVFHYLAAREDLLRYAGEVLEWVAESKLVLHVDGRFPLALAAQAHVALASRQTTGKLLLIPQMK